MLEQDNYTYRVMWSEEDGEYVGVCLAFPSLSWLAGSREEALDGIKQVVAEVTQKGSRADFERFLAAVPDGEPQEGDEL